MAKIGDNTYGDVYAFSTLFLFESQEAQVQCFQTASRQLRQDGVFVVEGFVHDRGRWQHLHECVTTRVGENVVGLRVALLDPVNQLIKMQLTANSATQIAIYEK